MIALSAVFCSVRSFFFVIFGSLAVGGASFSSQIVTAFRLRSDLRSDMSKIELLGAFIKFWC